MSCDGYHYKEKAIPKWQKIALIVAFVAFLCVMLFAEGCAPKHRVVSRGSLGSLTLLGYDTDGDGNVNYWQHYDRYGNKVAEPIYVR